MNILIVGGLLILGIAAVLGAVFLAISDQRQETTRVNGLKLASEVKQSTPTVPIAPPVPPVQPVQKELVPPQTAPTVTTSDHQPPSKTTLVLNGMQHEDVNDMENLPAFNGQFHELANEVRSLHQQAWQLEQRLSVLTEMVNHFEGSQLPDDHYDVEEADEEGQGTHIPSENTIV